MPSYDVVLSLDTSIYAAGDLLADTQLVNANVFRNPKGAVLDSVRIIDDDDQGIAMDLLFLRAATSLGTENGAPNMSDANVLAALIATLSIVAGDYVDVGGAKVVTKTNLNIPLDGSPTVGLYIGAITRGTPTHVAAGVKIRLGIIYK